MLFLQNLLDRTRVAGFSDCSMKSLAKLNDFCLYDRPQAVSYSYINKFENISASLLGVLIYFHQS